MEADVLVLVSPLTKADIDAVIEVGMEKFRVMSKHARYAISGALDHYELGCTFWGGES